MGVTHALQTNAPHLHPSTRSHHFNLLLIIIIIIIMRNILVLLLIIIILLRFPQTFLRIHHHDLSLELFGLCLLSLCARECFGGVFAHICIPVLVWSELQGETKILKLKNLRPQDYANYSCIASVRNVCGIPDRSVIFTLTNRTGTAREAVREGPKTLPLLSPSPCNL